VLLKAIIAESVGKIDIQARIEVFRNILPVSFIIPDLFAVHADRQQAFQLYQLAYVLDGQQNIGLFVVKKRRGRDQEMQFLLHIAGTKLHHGALAVCFPSPEAIRTEFLITQSEQAGALPQLSGTSIE
jgi:hypothetical protein